MYAIFADGSHQFRVREGDRITVDRRDGEPGTELVFSQVMLLSGNDSPTIRAPRSSLAPKSGPRSSSRLDIPRRSSSRSSGGGRTCRRRKGHRQPYTQVLITAVVSPG